MTTKDPNDYQLEDLQLFTTLKYMEADEAKSPARARALTKKADAMLAVVERFSEWRDQQIATGRGDDLSYGRFKAEMA